MISLKEKFNLYHNRMYVREGLYRKWDTVTVSPPEAVTRDYQDSAHG
jgi:hypothetical protein